MLMINRIANIDNIKKIQRSLLTITLCIGAATTLQGCVEMAVGTAVIGTLAATDRRTIGAQTEDKSIVLKGELRVAEIVGEKGHVNVNSFNRKILLTGEVKDQQMKEAVGRAVSGVDGAQAFKTEFHALQI
jgi:osmotically-inducible protein OsmY